MKDPIKKIKERKVTCKFHQQFEEYAAYVCPDCEALKIDEKNK